MKLFNTLTRKTEEFKSLKEKEVGMYICGPTVYDFAHIGHGRTYVNSDVLVRALRWSGYQVKVVMNITDVGHLTSDEDSGEDKVEKKAREEKQDVWQIVDFYSKDFWKMVDMLNIQRPEVVSKATDHIEEMIALVKRLEEKGFTYKTSDGVYFDTGKLKDYGKLARLDKAGLKEGARVEKNPEKRNSSDFALWKFAGEGEKRQMEWKSPWGEHTFPGWHIECSAMSMRYLGESFDLHTGGIDHIPVHHTNEIAQAEAATGKQFVGTWFHSGFLRVEGEKMSKSLGNMIRVEDVVKKGYSALALRYLFLTTHYRAEMNFTWEAMAAAQKAFTKLKAVLRDLKDELERTAISQEKLDKVDHFRSKFTTAVANDLAMPEALAIVWAVVKSNIPGRDKYDLLVEFDRVLGLGLGEVQKVQEIPDEVMKLVKQRDKLRSEEKWEEADVIRKKIEDKSYGVEDSNGKTLVKK